jgi:hypothetical protein
MLFHDIITDYLPVLDSIPPDGMLYYLQTENLLRGRRHQNTFFMQFLGGEKSVFDFFRDNTFNVFNRILANQSWEVQMLGYWFVKLFPLPYVIMPIPYPFFGFWTEPAAPNKKLAIISKKTEQQGRKSRGRMFHFGMPASWIDDNRLNGEGLNRLDAHTQTWQQLFTEPDGESEYRMMLVHRYVDGSYHSPLNPINWWPVERFLVKGNLVKHRPPALTQRP